MKYRVYQHWDTLKVCAVGRSYPPEYYSWIKNSKVRQLFETIATQTEEDYQAIIAKLQCFDVDVVRPDISHLECNNKLYAPPMNPRDCMVMIGQKFYTRYKNWPTFYADVKDPHWPRDANFNELEDWQQKECLGAGWPDLQTLNTVWQPVYDKVQKQGNDIIVCNRHSYINGAEVSRIGRDLYFSHYGHEIDKEYLANQFSEYRIHTIATLGHGDGTYCAVAPGLIISLNDVPTYANTFPGWEVIYLPDQSWHKVQPFLDLKQQNGGKWWIPGWEYDQDVVCVVETWLKHWVGYVEETVFDVNMLIVDPKNVIVFNENEQVFKALDRYGITPHVVPFRHRYFWDGGIHCITLDLNRDGEMQDYFPERA